MAVAKDVWSHVGNANLVNPGEPRGTSGNACHVGSRTMPTQCPQRGVRLQGGRLPPPSLMAASSTGEPPPGTREIQEMLTIEMRRQKEIEQGLRRGISNEGAQSRPVPPAPRWMIIPEPQDLEYWRFNPDLPLAQFPGWMKMRSGQEYCVICRKYATNEHLESENHIRRAIQFEAGPWDVTDQFISEGGSGTLGAGASVPDLAHGHIAQRSEEAPQANARAHVGQGSLPELAVPSLPAAAGDRHFYTYFPGVQRWYCRLCWKWVDDVHVQSKKHLERALIPEVFGVYHPPPPEQPPPPPPPMAPPPPRWLEDF